MDAKMKEELLKLSLAMRKSRQTEQKEEKKSPSKIESATAEEIKGAEMRRKERAEIKKRQETPLKKSRVSFKNEAEAKKAAKALPFEKWVNSRERWPESIMEK